MLEPLLSHTHCTHCTCTLSGLLDIHGNWLDDFVLYILHSSRNRLGVASDSCTMSDHAITNNAVMYIDSHYVHIPHW